MVIATKVNAERVYYNYGGQLPPVTLEPEPVVPPSASHLGTAADLGVLARNLRKSLYEASYP